MQFKDMLVMIMSDVALVRMTFNRNWCDTHFTSLPIFPPRCPRTGFGLDDISSTIVGVGAMSVPKGCAPKASKSQDINVKVRLLSTIRLPCAGY